MEIRAHLKNVHMSPRKMRLVRSVVKGLPAQAAAQQLQFMSGKASGVVLKVLKSAIANARHNFEADEANLVVGDVVINEGIVMKRFRPVSKGMAHPILKRMSHVTVILEDKGAIKAKKPKAKKTDIVDITPDEHIRQGKQAAEETTEEVTAGESAVAKPDKQKPAPDKQMQAFQKIKMQQGGGDRAKSHRRKSMSEG